MEVIRYGVVGCGQRLRHLVDLLSKYDSIELGGAWDPDARNSEHLNRLGSPEKPVRTFRSYEQLLEEGSLDWILVGSPNVYHRAHIELALAKGLHVFAEKPLATTAEDCLALARLARRSDRTLMTGFTLRYAPLYRQVRQILDSGKIGRVVSIDANENLTPGHGTYIMTNWRRDYQLAGAHILEKCVHDLDLLNWFTGSLPVRVAAFGGNNMFVPELAPLFDRSPRFLDWDDARATGLNPFTTEKSIEDNLVAILEYRNGTRAQFQLTSSNAIGERRMFISGTEGTLIVDLVAGTIKLKTIYEPQVICWGQNEGGDAHGGGDEVMTKELVDTMTLGTAPACGIEEGLRSTLVGLSIDQARREGRVIELSGVWTALDGAQ